MARIYKILGADEWMAAQALGTYEGSAIDRADGFIHFSGADQVKETAAKHFSGQRNLVIVVFDGKDLGESLKWEPSRGGALFPHLYGLLDPTLAQSVTPLPWDGDRHIFPVGWNE